VSKVTIREAVLMTAIVGILLLWWQERSRNAVFDRRFSAIEKRIALEEEIRTNDYERRLSEIEQGLVRYFPPDVAVGIPVQPRGASHQNLPPPGSIPTIPVTGPNDH
jgi:hypothetical protein